MKNIAALIEKIQPLDENVMLLTQRRLDNLTKPLGSLASLENMARQYCGAKRELRPRLPKKKIVIMAADHGVAEEGISAYLQKVTAQMVHSYVYGRTAINVLARHAGADLELVDVGVKEKFSDQLPIRHHKLAFGTHNMRYGAAMSREQALAAINIGIDIANKVIDEGVEALGLGELGIGNTTAAAAMASVFTGKKVAALTGYGSGINNNKLNHKIKVIEDSIAINNPNCDDPLAVLSKVGGFEIAALAGAILACAARRTLVMLDGFVSTTAALAAYRITKNVKPYLIAAHLSREPGHQVVLDELGLRPNLKLNMYLGQGTGAALGLTLLDAGIKVLNEMATFEEANVAFALADLKMSGENNECNR